MPSSNRWNLTFTSKTKVRQATSTWSKQSKRGFWRASTKTSNMKQAAKTMTAEQSSKEVTTMLVYMIRKKTNATLCQWVWPIRCSRKLVVSAISLESSKILTHKCKSWASMAKNSSLYLPLVRPRQKARRHPNKPTKFKKMIQLTQRNQNVERKELETIDSKKWQRMLYKTTIRLKKRLFRLQRKESNSILKKRFYQCLF